MKNSSPYRKPPVKRTQVSYTDDRNLTDSPRIDLGKSRHTQVRRDQDKVKNLGVTLYDIDFAVKSFIDKSMQLKVEDNGESIIVPIIYANESNFKYWQDKFNSPGVKDAGQYSLQRRIDNDLLS